MSASSPPLVDAVRDIERHVAGAGWDQPTRLYALVRTAALVDAQPALADQVDPTEDPGHLTAVEQEDLPAHIGFDELLAQVAWPPTVDGVALVAERVVLPPEVERTLPRDPVGAERAALEHPARQEVRLVVGVLRDGSRTSCIRLREYDHDDSVLTGVDLVPELAEGLLATLQPD